MMPAMTRLRWYLTPIAALFVVLAVACGGDDNNDSAGAAPTDGFAEPGWRPYPGAAGGGAGTSQALDLNQAATNLLQVSSFRFSFNLKFDIDPPDTGNSDEDAFGAAFLALLSDITVEGAYVAPDRFEIATSLFGGDFRAIRIADKAWVNGGDGWVEAPADEGLGMFEGALPTDLAFDLLPQEVLQGAETSSERVNGQDTTRYHFDKDSIAKLATDLGEELGGELNDVDTMDLDVWLTGEGIPVKMAVRVEGESEGEPMAVALDFNITDLNDSGINIQPPQ